jgi:hypothetical protein
MNKREHSRRIAVARLRGDLGVERGVRFEDVRRIKSWAKRRRAQWDALNDSDDVALRFSSELESIFTTIAKRTGEAGPFDALALVFRFAIRHSGRPMPPRIANDHT